MALRLKDAAKEMTKAGYLDMTTAAPSKVMAKNGRMVVLVELLGATFAVPVDPARLATGQEYSCTVRGSEPKGASDVGTWHGVCDPGANPKTE